MSRPLACLAAGAAFVAPPLLLVSDILLIQFMSTPGLVVQRIALVAFIGGLAGIAMLSRGPARWLVAAAAAVAIAGAGAIVIKQAWLAAPVRPPAVLFPVGLLALSAATLGSTVSRTTSALLALGALLFPAGHQTGAAAVLLGSDVMVLAALWSLARRMAAS
jgi:hypothetical protein